MFETTTIWKRSLLVVILSLLLWPGTRAEAGPPSLWYSTLNLNLSKEDALKRAYAAVASEVSGKLLRRENDVALANDQFNLAVYCQRIESKKTFVIIIVAHKTSLNEAKGLALNIRRGIETGIFE
jgi:hypothetical protein